MKATEALLWALAATVAILLAGFLLLCALRGWDWTDRDFRVVLLACVAPWAVLSWLALGNLRPSPRQVMGVEAGENIRLIPVRGGRLIEGIESKDLRFFVETICSTGDWTQRAWRGVVLPSGKRCNDALHAEMVNVLRRAGIIAGAGPRAAGRLAVSDAGEALGLLGLTD